MKNKKLVVISAFSCLLVVATIVGCTGTGGILFGEGGGGAFQFFTPKFAFLFNADGTNTITTFTVNGTSGALTVVDSGDATNASGCCQAFFDVDPNSQFLFVPNLGNDSISVFTINADGSLTGPVGADAAAGTYPFSVRLHPSGKFLYAANLGDNTISTFSVGAGGALSPVGAAIATSANPQELIMDWQGRFLYVTHESYYGDTDPNDTVDGYSINGQTGALTSLGSFATGGITPRGGMVDYSGQYLIIANRGNDNCGGCLPAADNGSISVLKIDSNGHLSPVAGSPFVDTGCDATPCGPFNPAEVVVGGTVYIIAGNLDAATLSVFALNTGTGALTPATGSPFDLGGVLSWPHWVAVDTSGAFAYVVDASNDNMYPVSISAAGAATAGSEITDPSFSWNTQLMFSH